MKILAGTYTIVLTNNRVVGCCHSPIKEWDWIMLRESEGFDNSIVMQSLCYSLWLGLLQTSSNISSGTHCEFIFAILFR